LLAAAVAVQPAQEIGAVLVRVELVDLEQLQVFL
jgi:hypothetical protein